MLMLIEKIVVLNRRENDELCLLVWKFSGAKEVAEQGEGKTEEKQLRSKMNGTRRGTVMEQGK